MKNDDYSESPLGKSVDHFTEYFPKHLFPIPRKDERKKSGTGSAFFFGEDVWNAYEISWLDSKGKPRIAIGTFRFPATTENIVESKSVKLYLNSFNQTRFPSTESVAAAMEKDLSEAAKGSVSVSLAGPEKFREFVFVEPGGVCIDELDIEIDQYRPEPGFLKSGGEKTEERLYSNLLRTNCPVTGQPDWATVVVDYRGQEIDRAGLLRYLASFREHSDFHENCVERMFVDILKRCKPAMLAVHARFTRRGGIDINPYRSNFEATPQNFRLARQ